MEYGHAASLGERFCRKETNSQTDIKLREANIHSKQLNLYHQKSKMNMSDLMKFI
jgi:hypothetical protein